jgi:hypothetical protein
LDNKLMEANKMGMRYGALDLLWLVGFLAVLIGGVVSDFNLISFAGMVVLAVLAMLGVGVLQYKLAEEE